MKRLLTGALLLLSVFAFGACSDDGDATATAGPADTATVGTGDEPADPVSVTVMLDWTPNTNHIGVYAALGQGYYAEAGLDVRIIEPAAAGVEAVVAEGQADFGFSYSEALLPARLAGVGITSIATALPHNESSLMSLASAGIERPRDFEGKRYGGFGGVLEQRLIETLVACDGGDPSKVEFVEVGNIDYIPGMQQDRFDFVWVFEGWDVIRARGLEGVEVTTLPFIDYTECIPDWYTPIIVTDDDLIANNPELVRVFLAATARGYDFAASNPDEAATDLLTAVPELDEQLVRDSAAYLASHFTDGAGWGQQQDAIWVGFEAFLREAGLIEEPVDVSTVYTNEFLPAS
ncbi:MAG: ABC transporter substrate-binding protein [Chloroflexi bacterium]|nr:ABC transporter substrate-binding protein [Chloroflexota bacterium]MDA1148127.1 ABC transporter substrate-binding protein [Chloroflexota bacterium]